MKLVVTRSTPARLLAASSNRPSTRAASWGFPSYRDSERADVITLGRRLLCITANLAAHVCPRWVKLRRTQCEQMFSGLPLKADLAQCSRHFAFVPTCDMAAIGRSDCAAAALCFRGELVLPNVFDLCANSRTGCRLAASCRCPCTRRNDEDGRVVAYAGKSPAER